MLLKIKLLSDSALDKINRKLIALIRDNLQETTQFEDLVKLRHAYTELNKLIMLATFNAKVGSWILKSELSQGKQPLNALQLLKNFLKVLDYPVTNRTNQEPRMSTIDIAKLAARLLLLCMVVDRVATS